MLTRELTLFHDPFNQLPEMIQLLGIWRKLRRTGVHASILKACSTTAEKSTS